MIRNSDPWEERLRKILGLPEEAPDPEALVWEESGPRPIEGAEAEQEWQRWHSEDWRADLARGIVHAPRKVLQSVKCAIYERRAYSKLAASAWVRFEATHSINSSEEWAIEGDLFFQGGSIPFHFVAAEGLAEHVEAESLRYDNYLYCEENDLLFENRWIVLPGKSVDQEEARSALEEWYRQIFLRRRRHPVAWGKMPQIEVLFHPEEQ